MTRELLQQANQITRDLNAVEARIQTLESIHHSDCSISIHCSQIGSVAIEDDELKDDIIDLLLRHLNNKKENLEDELRLL